MRHLHSTDVGFLEAFHDRQFAGVTPVNAIGVLSRADEVGAGRIDAIDIAERVAADYRRDAARARAGADGAAGRRAARRGRGRAAGA